MGRKGSRLVPFLVDALHADKYINLQKEDRDPFQLWFHLEFPHKTNRMGEACQLILKDWYEITGRSYRFLEDYTDGKQAMLAALRRSDYVYGERNGSEHNLVYRILTKEEIRDKKNLKRQLKPCKEKKNKVKAQRRESVASSSHSTDYDSGIGSPTSSWGNGEIIEENEDLLYGIKHDHSFPCMNTSNGSLTSFPVSNEDHVPQCIELNTAPIAEISPEFYENDPLGYLQSCASSELDKPPPEKDISDPGFSCSSSELNLSNMLNLMPWQDFLTLPLAEKVVEYGSSLCDMPDPVAVLDDVGKVENMLPLDELCDVTLDDFVPLADEYIESLDKYLQDGIAETKDAALPQKIYTYQNCVDVDGRIVLVCKANMQSSASINDEKGFKGILFEDELFKLISMSHYELKVVSDNEIWVVLKQGLF